MHHHMRRGVKNISWRQLLNIAEKQFQSAVTSYCRPCLAFVATCFIAVATHIDFCFQGSNLANRVEMLYPSSLQTSWTFNQTLETWGRLAARLKVKEQQRL